jgi:FMN hydrolase / 5-amino-6-(5-phospho-D-ribitylamino)uracil phosphatase
VAFDADGTLVDITPAVRAGLMAVSAATGIDFEEFWSDSNAHWAATPERPAREIRTAAMLETLSRFGQQSRLDDMVSLFFEQRYANTRTYSGVVEMLGELRDAGYRLGYATNANSRTELCGLGGLFDFEIYAFENGVPKKPHADFFHAMLAAGAARPDQVVYVGDTYAHDVVGAAAVGIRTVWLNRAGTPVPRAVRPDAVVRNLGELPDILTEWRARMRVRADRGSRLSLTGEPETV